MTAHDDGAVREATHFIDGQWIDGNPPIVGPMTHGLWMSSVVFDGARAFEGVTPDLDRHCARVINSARTMGLEPPVTAQALVDICLEGVTRFPHGTPLYIRPLLYAENGFVVADAASTRYLCSLFILPMPSADGFTAALSSRRRPSPEMAPTQAKASCLYPNAGLALKEAKGRGFDSALMLDPLGNIAEFATSNIFIVKDGVVSTPVPNGTFLNGITRQRVMALLHAAGVTVEERTLTLAEVLAADEVFSTGNWGKVVPVRKIEDRDYGIGPVAAKARTLYWDFAHGR